MERTLDGRHIVVGGRRWRATDPGIPEKLRAELVAGVMHARRAVRTHAADARPWVQDAKVALGERGDPWWEPTDDGRSTRLAAAIRTILRGRPTGSMCPSEAARIAGGESWRALMPLVRERLVREIARAMHDAGEIRIQQGGLDVPPGVSGPIRLAPGPALRSWHNPR